MKKRTNYVDNKRMYEEIVEYRKKLFDCREKGMPDPKIPEYIGECIYKIANNLSTKPSFVNYSYRDEMISDGILNCFQYFNDYDPEKGKNPFAYFTQVIYYAFIRRINSEEKNRYTIYKNFQETIIGTQDSTLLVDSDDNHLMPTQMYDNISSFMENFERKEKERVLKRKRIRDDTEKESSDKLKDFC